MKDSLMALRAKRDDLNAQVKELFSEVKSQRDRLNSINAKIDELREKRDSKNKLVKDLVKKRKTIIEKIKESRKIVNENNLESAKYEQIPKDLAKLKAEIKKLDWDIQTRQHSIKQDEQMQKRLENMEESLSLAKLCEKTSKKSAKSRAKISSLEEELELMHELIVDNNHAGNKEHEQLLILYRQIKELKTDVAPKFKKIRELREQADAAHNEYIAEQKKLRHEKEAKIKSEEKRREKEKNKKQEDLKKKAQDLYKEFTNGKKLTSEELIIIQKYGQ